MLCQDNTCPENLKLMPLVKIAFKYIITNIKQNDCFSMLKGDRR